MYIRVYETDDRLYISKCIAEEEHISKIANLKKHARRIASELGLTKDQERNWNQNGTQFQQYYESDTCDFVVVEISDVPYPRPNGTYFAASC